MLGYLIDAGATMTCPHQGRVSARPRRTGITVRGRGVFVAADFSVAEPVITGCAFTVAGASSPCLHVRWYQAAGAVELDGSAALVSTSVGVCLNAAHAAQGLLSVTGHQTEVLAA